MSNFITVSTNGKRKGFADIMVNINHISAYKDYYIMIYDKWIHVNETLSDIENQIAQNK